MPRTLPLSVPFRPGPLLRRMAAIFALLLVGSPALDAAEPGRRTKPPAGLPDTVLARVGGKRDVTVSAFRRAWAQVAPPARPDSLTPESAGGFLDLLVDREVLAERALREALPWSANDSLQFRAYRDNVVLRAFLDSLLFDMNRRWMAAGDTADQQVLGVAVRESVLAGLGVTFDEPLAARLAERWAAIPKPSPDSSMTAQLRMLGRMPEVDAADMGSVLARSAVGPFHVSELLDHWRRTDPLSRPRVNESSQIRDLAKNGLFERWLRAGAESARVERRPATAALIAARHEYHAVARLVQREVYDRLRPDSLTLRRWYEDHVDDYSLPDRVRVMELVLPTRAAASGMYVQLRDEASAESLLARGRRAGVEYRAEVTEQSDSTLFRAAWRAGAGAVVGPDSSRGGWRVARVREVLPSRRRSYEEAQVLVERQYLNVEGERLMRDLLARLRQEAVIRRHPAAGRLAAARP